MSYVKFIWATELLPYLGKSLDNQCQALLNMAADLKRPVPKNMNYSSGFSSSKRQIEKNIPALPDFLG